MNARSRREFLTTVAGVVTVNLLPSSAQAAQDPKRTRSAIGCHTRPFSRFRLNHDDLLDAIMVEGTAVGDTVQATIANARAHREFLERVLGAGVP
jgi:hypothetical protein